MSTAPPSLRERVAAAILEAAADALATHGEQASIADVAAAAGVARATVYRYFPNRQALLDALAGLAVRDAEARLREARLDDVAAPEALERAVRALVGVGNHLVVLERERVRPDAGQFDAAVAQPLRRLFERGQTDGDIRTDMSPVSLTESLVGLVMGILRSTPTLGVEGTTAVVTSLFLDGARTRGAAAHPG
ncbi:MAG: TetR family transcriptional regulator [Actinobacteria bacterium]|nr:MAG: TetR family transcriptional regulator [Actinomycetota bacterium]